MSTSEALDENVGEPETPARKRGRRNEARWNEILNAAGQVFAEKGYSDTTIDDIATRVGLLPGSLYYYIDSKEDLLYQWANSVHQGSLELTREPPHIAAADAEARLSDLIERWMENIHHAEASDAYTVLDKEARRLNPVLVDHLRGQRRAFISFVTEILEQGIAEGTFDPDMKLSVVVSSMVRLLWSTSQWYDPQGPQRFDEIADWYKRFILRGLRRPT